MKHYIVYPMESRELATEPSYEGLDYDEAKKIAAVQPSKLYLFDGSEGKVNVRVDSWLKGFRVVKGDNVRFQEKDLVQIITLGHFSEL